MKKLVVVLAALVALSVSTPAAKAQFYGSGFGIGLGIGSPFGGPFGYRSGPYGYYGNPYGYGYSIGLIVMVHGLTGAGRATVIATATGS